MSSVADHIRQVDHVAIALPDIAAAVPLFCDALGAGFIGGGDNPLNGLRIVHLQLPTTVGTELTAPNWKETFLRPHDTFGALLQFVQTTRDWSTPIRDFALDDVLSGRVQWRDHIPCLCP